MNKKTLRVLLQYLIFFGLGAILIYWQYSKLTGQDKMEIVEALQTVKSRAWLIIPVILLGFFSHFFRATRWKILMEPVGLNPSTANTTFAVLIGYLVNLLIPRMGEVAKCSVLAKYEDKPVDKIVGTVVAERFFDLLCLLLISLGTFLIQFESAKKYLARQFSAININPVKILFVVAGLLVVVVITIIFSRRIRNRKIKDFLTGLKQGVMAILKIKNRGRFFLYTFLIWFCYLALVYIGFRAVYATEMLGWVPALSVLVFGSVGMIATPGGIGAYPAAVQLILVYFYGIKSSYALAFGWLSWLAQTLIILVLGLLSLLILPVYNNRQNG